MIEAFDVYTKYIAIKLTYDPSNSYDYFTYGGKTRQSKGTFLKRKDRYHFYALGKKMNYDLNDVEAFLFANLAHNPEYWVGDLLSDQCVSRFRHMYRYKQNFAYALQSELSELRTYMDRNDVSMVDLLSSQNQTPKLMEFVYAEMFSPTLLHAMDRSFDLFSKWSNNPKSFEPLLLTPMKRMIVFGNFVYRYSHRLTKKQIRDIVKKTMMEE